MATGILSTRRLSQPPSLWALACQVLALAGCGGREGGSTTGLPSSALLGELTAEQASAGCGQLAALVERRFHRRALAYEDCTLSALKVATEVPYCTALRDMCVMARAQDPGAGSTLFEPALDVGCGEPSTSWSGCSATVEELESCLHDVLDGLAEAIETYTCEDAPTYRRACLPPINPYVAVDEVDPRTNMPPQCELLPVPDSCRALHGECSSLAQFAQ